MSPSTVTFSGRELRTRRHGADGPHTRRLYAVAPSVRTETTARHKELNTNIYTHLLRRCKSRARRPGAAAGAQAAWRGGPEWGRPRRGDNTMKSEEQSRGQAKGFFTGRGVLSIRLSMCKERIWCAVGRSNMFLHQLAGRVGPI